MFEPSSRALSLSRVPFCFCATFVILAVMVAFAPAEAATESEYEARIAALESRIAKLESMVERMAAAPASNGTAKAASDGSAGANPEDVVGTGAGDGAASEQTSEVAEVSTEDENALQALYVVRDQAVTVKPGRWEVDLGFSYTRDDALFETSWALGTFASLSYGLANGLEVGVTVPYDWTHRHTTGFGSGIDVDLQSIGDISFNVNKVVVKEDAKWPGIVLNGGLVVPTGEDPFADVSGDLSPGKNPTNPFAFYRHASGTYTVAAGVELFKTVDPFAFFGGVGVAYPFAREVGGTEVFPGYSIAYNIGTTFAVSEWTSLGFAINGAVNTSMVTGGKKVNGTDPLPITTSLSVLQRVSDSFYVEPELTIGLTEDAPDAVITLTTTKQF